MSDLLDVLTLAGGVKKSGTLRNIKIIKNDKVSTIDLYKSLFYIADESQANAEISITHNMKIIVPPILKLLQ